MVSDKPRRGRPPSGIKTKPIMVRVPKKLLREFKKYQLASKSPTLQDAIRQAMTESVANLAA